MAALTSKQLQQLTATEDMTVGAFECKCCIHFTYPDVLTLFLIYCFKCFSFPLKLLMHVQSPDLSIFNSFPWKHIVKWIEQKNIIHFNYFFQVKLIFILDLKNWLVYVSVMCRYSQDTDLRFPLLLQNIQRDPIVSQSIHSRGFYEDVIL